MRGLPYKGTINYIYYVCHLLFKLIFTIANSNRVVMSVQAVNERLDRRFIQVTYVGYAGVQGYTLL